MTDFRVETKEIKCEVYLGGETSEQWETEYQSEIVFDAKIYG